jgi:adenine-specific DNA-methyltransferase
MNKLRSQRIVLSRKPDTSVSYLAPSKSAAVIHNGDCESLLSCMKDGSIDLTVTSPPYCMGKEYEPWSTIDEFKAAHARILPEIVRVTKPGGSICWQVGNFVRNGEVVPLDFLIYELVRDLKDLKLRNRIVWTFDHGRHCSNRFSGRHETVLWFTKGKDYRFFLDQVRVPQKYPGKKHYKGPKKGELSGNPLGKNPGDVWSIPHVKSQHVEKTLHPCQFPIALPQRLIRALCPPRGLVLDPFTGVGSTGAAAVIEGRRFIGAETDSRYAEIAEERMSEAIGGKLRFRPVERPIYVPSPGSSVARKPAHFGGA